MAIIQQGDLFINNVARGYEGNITTRLGGKTRESFPQVNAPRVIISKNDKDFAEIKMTLRITDAVKEDMTNIFSLGDGNTITFRNDTFTRAQLMELPEMPDTQTAEFVFHADSIIID